ncbi:MAG: transcriptional regulator [candidate division WOR-3 bacterium]|jgi:DNA-binding HxlR family transcriptional regulator
MNFEKLNPIFHDKVRLGILSILLVEEEVDFSYLKEKLNLTDGNLASHLKVLEQNKIIISKKVFVQRKPKTYYQLTEEGKRSFLEYLENLKQILNNLLK